MFWENWGRMGLWERVRRVSAYWRTSVGPIFERLKNCLSERVPWRNSQLRHGTEPRPTGSFWIRLKICPLKVSSVTELLSSVTEPTNLQKAADSRQIDWHMFLDRAPSRNFQKLSVPSRNSLGFRPSSINTTYSHLLRIFWQNTEPERELRVLWSSLALHRV